jgi:hypothetical protein
MRRIAKVLVVTALMVVLMAITVSPAVASNGWGKPKDHDNGWHWSQEFKPGSGPQGHPHN